MLWSGNFINYVHEKVYMMKDLVTVKNYVKDTCIIMM
jgi:hypothetical protein